MSDSVVFGITALISKSAFSPSVVAPSSTVGISEFTGIASNEKIEMLAYQVSGLYITIKQHVAAFVKFKQCKYYVGILLNITGGF